jgi:hypothetical protein
MQTSLFKKGCWKKKKTHNKTKQNKTKRFIRLKKYRQYSNFALPQVILSCQILTYPTHLKQLAQSVNAAELLATHPNSFFKNHKINNNKLSGF